MILYASEMLHGLWTYIMLYLNTLVLLEHSLLLVFTLFYPFLHWTIAICCNKKFITSWAEPPPPFNVIMMLSIPKLVWRCFLMVPNSVGWADLCSTVPMLGSVNQVLGFQCISLFAHKWYLLFQTTEISNCNTLVFSNYQLLFVFESVR